MASNPANAIVGSKGSNSSKISSSSGQSSPAPSQVGPASAGDGYSQRRAGGSGSFGAGSSSRAVPAPRNNQSSRKPHKSSKRFRMTDDDVIAETTAMRSASSRKGQTSITHLMNFSLPPRPYQHQNQQQHYPHGHHGLYTSQNHRNPRRGPAWGLGSGYHAVDKARYVHANYRFIVDPRPDYHAQGVDADEHVEWNSVMQILVSSQSQSTSCPICLGQPVAPRMAKCGHIFCLPCLIRYMHSEDESGRSLEKKARCKKCPLCWDGIYISETRPVRWYAGQEADAPREGGDVVLRLVMRSSGSTLALPRDGAQALARGEDIPWYFAAEVMDYARIMKGTEEYMNGQFDNDIEALEAQEREDELLFGEDNIEWSRRAVRMLNEAKDKIKGIGGPPSTSPSKPKIETKTKPPIEFDSSKSNAPEMYAIQHASSSGRDISSNAGVAPARLATLVVASTASALASASASPDAGPSITTKLADIPTQSWSPNATPSEYYFYQALLHYYLSPLDIRILKEAFGNFASFPSTILPRVERVSTGHIVDDELRKRAKYLAHLPYGCEVGFLECDWTDTVPAEILEKFKTDIERRRKRNEEKETREERARVRAEKEEDEKRYAHLRRRRPEDSSSSSSWNRFNDDDFRPLLPAAEQMDDAVGEDEDTTSSSPPWGTRREGSAFASLASISTSPSASRTVWGTRVVPPTTPPLIAAPGDHDVVDDGWLQGWENDLLQEEEDLVAQAQSISLTGEQPKGTSSGNVGLGGGGGGGGTSSSGGGGGSSGKKKKAKKITLMSTNVRRGA